MRKTLHFLFMLLLFFFTAQTFGQNRELIGKVTDAAGVPLPGVTISVKGASIGAVTDFDGEFSIEVPNDALLVFSSVGFETLEERIGSNNNLSIILQEDLQVLDEVVIVGYGTQKRSSLTSAVSDVAGETLNQRVVSDASQALQGLAPGVTVVDGGGGPGKASATIRIRGLTTLSGNSPLVLVDGFEQKLENLNPQDIETITILKDAASTAIYGSRAANGVVLITTKRGSEGKVTASLNSYYGIQQAIFKPKQIGMEDYMRMQNVAFENAGAAAPFSEEDINTWLTTNDRINYPLVNDWLNQVFSPAPQQSHTLTIGGGTEKLRTLLSLNHFDQKGIISNSNSKENNFRLNTDYNISDRITLSSDISYRLANYKSPTRELEAIKYIWASSNFAVPRYPDGTYGLSSDGISPLVQSELRGVSRFKDVNSSINLKAKIDLWKGLSFQTQYALTSERQSQKIYNNAYEITEYQNPDVILQKVSINSLEEVRNYSEQHTLNNLLRYETEIGSAHSLIGLLGYSQDSFSGSFLSASRRNFYNNDIRALSQGAADTKDNQGFETDWGLRSYFGRVSYNFDEKYFFEVNARYDGSSRFSSSNRFGFFPSFSGAWRISQEKFWIDNLNVVNEFKIRGSWGQTGNQSVGLYSFLETLAARNYSFGGQAVQGLYQSALANEDLTWETTTQSNIGLDLSFLKDKISLTFDYYNKATEGILLVLPIPLSLGLDAPPQNAGNVENKGWETAISYKGAIKDFNFDIAFNISDVKNEITNLEGTGPYISNSNWVSRIRQVGLPIDSFLGYKSDGFYQSQDEVDNSPLLFPDAGPGDIKYVDVNNDGLINPSDRIPLGSDIPRYTFGLNTNFNFKNFDMNAFFQGVGKADFMVGEWAGNVAWQSFVMDFQKDYWTPDNRDAAHPRPVAFADNNWVNSDFWIVDAAYLKLKNLQIGYTFPSNITKNLQKLRLYVSGSNVFTISKVNKWGFDPEANTGLRNYPTVSIYSVGLNVTF